MFYTLMCNQLKQELKKLKRMNFWLENPNKYLESPVCACGECNFIEDLKKDRENIRINMKRHIP